MTRPLKNLAIRLLNISPISVHSVFTPATAAEANYVSRPELENIIVSELDTQGKQILLFGHSGSGKTTIIRSIVKSKGLEYIRTHCEKATTYADIIRDGFDKLDHYYLNEKTISEKQALSAQVAADIKVIKSQIVASTESSEANKYTRMLPPQLTPQRLAQMIGESGLIWIIEDFHKVEEIEKKRIADLLKFFCDIANDYPQSKIVCIGACESANELVALEPNLKGRVSEIHVSLLSEEAIRAIAENGFELLNISADKELIDQVVFYSARLGSTAHQMCLDICNGIGVSKRSWKEIKVNSNAFNHAVKGFIKKNEGTLSVIYEAAVKDEVGWYILKTLSNNKHEKLQLREICKIINMGKKQFKSEEVYSKLVELATQEYGVVYFNPKTENFSIASPFWRSFLRMQFAMEAAKKNTKSPVGLNLKDQNDIEAIVEKMMLELLNKYSQMYSSK